MGMGDIRESRICKRAGRMSNIVVPYDERHDNFRFVAVDNV